IARQRPKIARFACFRPQDGAVTSRACRCAGNLVQVVDVAPRAVVASGQNAEIAHSPTSRPQESSPAIGAGRISSHMAVLVDAKCLSTLVARQQRNPPKTVR